jgi:DNA polymerase-3 subunit chi
VARVDFYVLAAAGEQSRYTFACRLAEKAYRLDNCVHIETSSAEDARRMDELLWTFRDGSFVPHHLLGSERNDLPSPVTIGCDKAAAENCDLLINLCDEVQADFVAAFPRIAELVSSDEESRQRSRKRFVLYRDQGHTLETHNV